MSEKPSAASGQLVPLKDRFNNVRGLLEKAKPQIAMALPKHLTPDRMMRVALTAITRTPKLLDCTKESLLGAIVQCAQLGLEPDGVLGLAYLVPYGKDVTLIPGYKGLIALARRSGQISTIDAEVVHEKDRFSYALGLKPTLVHVPSTDDDPGPVTYIYAVARMKDGGSQFKVMTKAQIEKVRGRSRAGQSGPWVTDWDEMAKKTVLRRLCKLLPVSVELQTAVALDEAAEAGMPQTFDVIDVTADDPAHSGTGKAKLDELTDTLSPAENAALDAETAAHS